MTLYGAGMNETGDSYQEKRNLMWAGKICFDDFTEKLKVYFKKKQQYH